MSRKELYDKVRDLGLASIIKEKYGDNYTRVSNSNLEECINAHMKGNKKKEKKEDVADKAVKSPNKTSLDCKNCKEAVIKLISTLQIRRMITAKEAEEIAELLK